MRLGGGTGATNSGTTGALVAVFNDPRIMANPLHPIFIDLVKMATAPRFPANLREEEHAQALHQTMMPIWLGERKPDDAFFDELTRRCQARARPADGLSRGRQARPRHDRDTRWTRTGRDVLT